MRCGVGESSESGESMLLALLPDWEAGRDGAGGVFCGVAGWGLRLGPVIGEENAVQRCCDAKDSNSCTWDVHGAVMGREVRVWVCVYG